MTGNLKGGCGCGEHVVGPAVQEGVAWVGRRLKRVAYTVVDGEALVEGCIVLGDEEEVRQITAATEEAKKRGLEPFGVIVSDPKFRWPRKTVPYDVSTDLPDQERVAEAIEHWRNRTSLKFVERTQANRKLYPNWVTFRPGRGCSSRVGCRGGQQFITLGTECGVGNVIHEIGHTVGLFHEQAREDRDRHVRINFDRIDADYRHNFDQHITDGDDVGEYDYGSIMHYPPDAFSKDGRPTIEAPEGIEIGQRLALSAGDVAAVEAMYA